MISFPEIVLSASEHKINLNTRNLLPPGRLFPARLSLSTFFHSPPPRISAAVLCYIAAVFLKYTT
jgi:hypothetical protein